MVQSFKEPLPQNDLSSQKYPNVPPWGPLRWWEAGEIGKDVQHCAIFHNRKKRKEAGDDKNRAETRIKGYRKHEV